MCRNVAAILFVIVATGAVAQEPTNAGIGANMRFAADSAAGFHWPYYLYVSPRALSGDSTITLLVEPNNTGTGNDSFMVHDSAAATLLSRDMWLADRLGGALLVPVFPRPYTNWQLYVQALDRDVLATDDSLLVRIDLQLLAMIDHAREFLGLMGHESDTSVFLFGFSASGQFADRFTTLHPSRVKAAAIGSPGGWPIAPLDTWDGKQLPYPVGIADIRELTGQPIDRASYQQTPVFLFLGDRDTNDAVMYEDAFSSADRDLILSLFGESPVARWSAVSAVRDSGGCACELRLYEGVGHTITRAMWEDIAHFFERHR